MPSESKFIKAIRELGGEASATEITDYLNKQGIHVTYDGTRYNLKSLEKRNRITYTKAGTIKVVKSRWEDFL